MNIKVKTGKILFVLLACGFANVTLADSYGGNAYGSQAIMSPATTSLSLHGNGLPAAMQPQATGQPSPNYGQGNGVFLGGPPQANSQQQPYAAPANQLPNNAYYPQYNQAGQAYGPSIQAYGQTPQYTQSYSDGYAAPSTPLDPMVGYGGNNYYYTQSPHTPGHSPQNYLQRNTGYGQFPYRQSSQIVTPNPQANQPTHNEPSSQVMNILGGINQGLNNSKGWLQRVFTRNQGQTAALKPW